MSEQRALYLGLASRCPMSVGAGLGREAEQGRAMALHQVGSCRVGGTAGVAGMRGGRDGKLLTIWGK